MTHNHPLWRQQDREAARAALAKLASSPEERRAKAGTEREKGYLAALEALYGEGGKVSRDLAYAETMRGLSARIPDDLEAKAFYALAILGTGQGVRDFRTYMRAGAVAEEVFAANPRHPGAAHYLIHSYDDPVHAPLGLRAARVYSQIAPAATHAQHMISHIYVALGEWEDSVEANVKSFEMSAERRQTKNLAVDALNYHALQWLQYSHLQLGQWEQAKAEYDAMVGYEEESDEPRAQWYRAAMRAAWVVGTDGKEVPTGQETADLALPVAAFEIFATGYGAAKKGDQETAQAALAALEDRLAVATQTGDEVAGDVYAQVSDEEMVEATGMVKSLQALVELGQDHPDSALALLGEATALEAAKPLEFGPPEIVKPSHELYGEILLLLGRPEEVRAQFEVALQRAPRRSHSLSGLAQAARAVGDTVAVQTACSDLARSLREPDASVRLPGACAGSPVG